MPARQSAGSAQLRAVAAELRTQTNGEITARMRRQLAGTVRPLAPRVRAAILNIPSAGKVPYHQPPGLRARIAACVQVWSYIQGELVRVGIEMDSSRMPDGQKALPLYMDGAKPRWRHPVFGDVTNWVAQGNAPHPYWDDAVAPAGPASRRAIERVAQELARRIDAAAG